MTDTEQQPEALTQAAVDAVFSDIKAHWDRMVAESGRTEQMFLALGGPEVSDFLAHYQLAKEHVESLGLAMPTLVEGLSISVSVDGDASGSEEAEA